MKEAATDALIAGPSEPDIDVEDARPDAPVSPQSRQPPTHAQAPLSSVIFAVAFYIGTSITMVILNKQILNEKSQPLSLLLIQLLVAAALLKASEVVGLIALPRLSFALIKKLTSLIAVNVLGLVLNTLCLQVVDASFFQVARSMVLPSTVGLSASFLGTNITMMTLVACIIVTAGFLTGSLLDGAAQISAIGVVLGILSSVTTAIHAIIIKSSVHAGGAETSTIGLVYLNNLLSAILLFPLVAVAEGCSDNLIPDWGSIISGVVGFGINLAGFWQIKVTGPVSHMISSAVRGVLQTFIAISVFGDIVSFSRWAGIALVLSGSALYVFAQSWESQAKDVARGDIDSKEREKEDEEKAWEQEQARRRASISLTDESTNV